MLLLCVESDFILLGLSLRQTILSRGGRKALPDGPTTMPCLSLCLLDFLVCLHDFLCIYFSALLSFCLTANLSVNRCFLFDRPCLVSPTITASHTPPMSSLVPISQSLLLKNLSSSFTAHYFFMSSEEQIFLALLHPTDPQDRQSQPPGDQTEAVC